MHFATVSPMPHDIFAYIVCVKYRFGTGLQRRRRRGFCEVLPLRRRLNYIDDIYMRSQVLYIYIFGLVSYIQEKHIDAKLCCFRPRCLRLYNASMWFVLCCVCVSKTNSRATGGRAYKLLPGARSMSTLLLFAFTLYILWLYKTIHIWKVSSIYELYAEQLTIYNVRICIVFFITFNRVCCFYRSRDVE